MDIQYISDKHGKPTGVLISIEDWNVITTQHIGLKALEKPKGKPSDYRGAISKKTADELLIHVEQSRRENQCPITNA